MEYIGWAGSILLAICALPSAIEAIINKKTNIPYSLLIPWTLGEILTLIYVVYLNDVALIFNYGLNLVFISVILKYKIRPEEKNEVS
jgi:uncharacterized protein with PQ loop repeat